MSFRSSCLPSLSPRTTSRSTGSAGRQCAAVAGPRRATTCGMRSTRSSTWSCPIRAGITGTAACSCFPESSGEFAGRWHDYALLALEDPYWEVRDQGTLAATAWRLGLASHAVLPARFNRIVDRFRGHPEARRASLTVSEYRIDTDYGFGDCLPPVFLHFINGGIGARGWKNWDDAEALLARATAAPRVGPC